MKKEQRSKKNRAVCALALVAVTLLIINNTTAFFTDEDSVTNTFTMGSVKISLEEPGWEEEDGVGLLPGNVRVKDPTVTAVEGQSYMRIRMEIVDGEGNLLTDSTRINLILNTLYYDTSYDAALYLTAGGKYTRAELDTLSEQDKINQEYNKNAFTYAGFVTGSPGIRYYEYTAGDGIFDADTDPAETATLFSNILIPSDWGNEEIYILSGDEYEEADTGSLEITVKGTGYKLILTAEAIQASDMESAREAFQALDEASGITRDTSGL